MNPWSQTWKGILPACRWLGLISLGLVGQSQKNGCSIHTVGSPPAGTGIGTECNAGHMAGKGGNLGILTYCPIDWPQGV